MKISNLRILITLFLITATLIVFGQVISHDFINYDDGSYVYNNSHVRKGWSVQGVKWAFTTRFHLHWHPLTWLSHMTDCMLFGINPGAHHLTNLLIHISNMLLLLFILNRVTGAFFQSALVAALFALHPLHVEPVAWIADRKDLLSTFFWLVTMWTYARYVKNPGVKKYLLVFMSYILALMSKSMVITIPAMLLLMDYWPFGRFRIEEPKIKADQMRRESAGSRYLNKPSIRLVLEKMPFFFPMIAGAVLTFMAIGFKSFTFSKLTKIIPGTNQIANALVSYAYYIYKMIWPFDLAIPYPKLGTQPLTHVAGAGTVLLGISILAYVRRRHNPYLLMGWLWYLVTLLPVIGLVKAGPHILADRYTYVPMIGLFIMIAWGVPDIFKKARHGRQILAVLAGVVILSCIAISWQMTRNWKNSETIFRHSVGVTKNNHVAHNNLGTTLLNQKKTKGAIYHFSRALEAKPQFAKAHNNMGLALARQRRLNKAIYHYTEAVRIKPNYAKAHYHLGNAFLKQGKYKEAAASYSRAVKIQPKMDTAHNNLGIVMSKLGNHQEAIRHYSRAIKINPRHYKAHNSLGSELMRQGRLDEAIYHFSRAIMVKPNYAKAYNNKGIALSKQGKLKEAKRYFSLALKIDPDYAEARRNLGRALLHLETHRGKTN